MYGCMDPECMHPYMYFKLSNPQQLSVVVMLMHCVKVHNTVGYYIYGCVDPWHSVNECMHPQQISVVVTLMHCVKEVGYTSG